MRWVAVLVALFILPSGVASSAATGSSAVSHIRALSRSVCDAAARQHHQVGLVTNVRRHLQVQHLRGKLEQAHKKTPLYAGDVVQTKSKDGATIALCDGSAVYINGQSELALSSTTLEREVYGEVAEKLSQRSTHTLQTTAASATGTGSRFEATTRKGTSTFVVAQGTVEVRNRFGHVRLAANQQTAALPDRAPRPPTRRDAGQALGWTTSVSGPTWSVLTTFDPAYHPQRLEVNAQGFIYVANIPPNSDPTHGQIVKLSPHGQEVRSWGLHASDGTLYGLALDSQSNVYVTDSQHARIEKFALNGRFLSAIGPIGNQQPSFVGLHGLEVDPAGNIYAVEYTGDTVQKLSPGGGSLVTFGGQGAVPGRLSAPEDVAVDRVGNVYIVDEGNARIQKFSPSGSVLKVFGNGEGNLGRQAPGQFQQPTDIALDAAGNIYVCERLNNRIQELSPAGQPLELWGSLGSGPGQFSNPTGVAVDATGNVYVADSGNHRIEKLTR